MNSFIPDEPNPFTAGKVVGPISDPAIYRNDNAKRGDPDFVMGRSSLMEFAWCPKRWIDGYESEETKATEWGDLIDCLFITPDQFRNRYAVQPATYPHDAMQCPVCKSVTDSMSCKKCKTQRVPIRVDKEWNSNSETCAEWERAQEGKTIVKHKLFQPACEAVKVLESDPDIKALRDCSQRQVMATGSYRDEKTSIVVPLGILIDLLPAKESKWGKALVDLKTTDSAAMSLWRKKVFKYNYDAQAALYLDLWTANTGEDRTDFLHIVQESYAPYQTEHRLMSAEFVAIGRSKYLRALEKYCECLKTGIWPGYDSDARQFDGWQIVEPEPWMVQ